MAATLVAPLLISRDVRAQGRPRWGDVAVSIEGVSLFASDYDEALRAFDHAPLGGAFAASARVTKSLLPWLSVGGRLGWLWTSSPVHGASLDPSGAPNATMVFNLVEVGAVLRFIATPQAVVAGGARAHVDVEAGAVMGNVSLLDVPQRWVRPRFGASFCVGYQGRETPMYIGVRAGLQLIFWDGAGGSSLDPVFSGMHGGVEWGFTP